MFECRTFISVKEICQVFSVSESKSYAIVRDLNKELSDKSINKYDGWTLQNDKIDLRLRIYMGRDYLAPLL